MQKQNPNPVFINKKMRLVLWGLSAAALCAVLLLSPASRADAQGSAQNPKRYASSIQQIFDFVQNHYVDEVEPEVLYEGAMNGMFDALGDPHSNFLTARDMAAMSDTTSGNFGGVGLYISKPAAEKNGVPPFVEVAAPMEDTPGWRAGIAQGDLIIEINGEPTDVLSMDEVLERLRGRPGSEVAVLVRRGKSLEFPVTLRRAVIEVPAAKHAVIGGVGYLKLLTFTPMTAARAGEAVEELLAAGCGALVLDLRNNYGGLLGAAVDVCDLFLDGGVAVSTRSRLPEENRVFHTGKSTAVPAGMPVVVLVNRASASASEIVAGALKDRGRAYLVGGKTYGKGSVQQVFPIPGGKDGFKITVARYYTPSGVNIDRAGIPPDLEVELPGFGEKDMEKLKALAESGELSGYIEKTPGAGSAGIKEFAGMLGEKYGLDAEPLRLLVRNEQNRKTPAPVYDLEYDAQLRKAVDILEGGSYKRLMEGTKTLRQLQDEAEKEAAAIPS
jgi:carboxyl-terminal processing protease